MSIVTTRPSILKSLILLYVLIYASFGVTSPFWPRFFETRGLSAEQIGVLFGFGALVRLVAGPIAARIADRLGQIRAVLAIAAALSACFGLGLVGTEGFWIFLLLHLCHEAAVAPTTALADDAKRLKFEKVTSAIRIRLGTRSGFSCFRPRNDSCRSTHFFH